MNWVQMLPKLARFSPGRITVGVTEKTARTRLKIKPPKPLLWNGIPLRCIGSPKWRRKIWELRNVPAETKQRCPGCGKKHEEPLSVCHSCLVLANAIDECSADTSRPLQEKL